MAVSIFDLYDPVNTQNPLLGAPALGASTPQGGVGGLLADRNFLALLAGVGQAIDPQGVGGRLGAVARTNIASQAAQDRATQQAAAQNAQTRMVIDALSQYGGLTPANTPGVTALKATPTGVQMDITPSGAPGAPSAPQGLEQPIRQTPFGQGSEAPQAPQAPLVSPESSIAAPTDVGVGVPTTGSPRARRDRLSALLPFYSALLG